MEVIIQQNQERAAALAARLIGKAIIEKPSLVLGLATGRTMELVYEKMAQMHTNEKLDYSLCRTFNLDEYVGLPSENEHSYRSYMNRHLFHKVNIDIRNTHIPDGMADDLSEECKDYEHRIEQCGGIDLQLLGIGRGGHIGFNEPLSALKSRTRDKALTPQTIDQNSPLFDKPEDMPRRALTMGVGTILESRRSIMLVTGTEKAEILAQAVEGPITSMVTASALQLHSHCTVIVDESAAMHLQGTDYYRWIFQNEPEWEEFR